MHSLSRRVTAFERAGAAAAAVVRTHVHTHARTFAVQPFHLAIPTHSLEESRKFYGGLLKCEEGRSAATWIDWNLYGHQIVTHFASEKYRGADHFNNVDADMVPVPHFGVCLTVDAFHELARTLKGAGVKFLVEPHLRFEGKPGEQWTMFFKDPSGNNLEFKAMTKPENLFARYRVDE